LEKTPTNLLLQALPAADFDLLRPNLHSEPMVHHDVLFEPGDVIDRAYFPITGAISLVVLLASGQMVEASIAGRDGVVGGAAALNGPASLSRAVVQLEGKTSYIAIQHLARAADQSRNIRKMLVQHEQALLAQSQQSAACNVSHNLETRLARWLLRARDLAPGDDLRLTQEFLSEMLGVQRSSVSIVANNLQQQGLIKYNRGKVQIVNVQGLRQLACECYDTVKKHYQSMLTSVSAGA
jgi:CRP-like cAMP-binding protein